MRKLFREPLLQFLLIGSALFLLFDAVSGSKGGADRKIVVNDATVAHIVQVYQGVWKRPINADRIAGIDRFHVREEILFREGVAMGLDRDDAVIRRRVQQKMVVITEESAARPAPSDAELDAYLKQHAERYARPAVIGFDQVVFDADAPWFKPRCRCRSRARSHLRAGVDPDTMGDRLAAADRDRRHSRRISWRVITAMISPHRRLRCRSVHGAARSHPATAFIWCASPAACRAVRRRWPKRGPQSSATGRASGACWPARTTTGKRASDTTSSSKPAWLVRSPECPTDGSARLRHVDRAAAARGAGRGRRFRPAYLQLKQLDAETFDVTWKVPALDAQTTLKVKPVFPAGTQAIDALTQYLRDGRGRATLAGAYSGRSGWQAGRIHRARSDRARRAGARGASRRYRADRARPRRGVHASR